ncbi:MAG: TRAP transporter fused permease subunit [Colwellia polaris]|jgi:TRAP transporter 4TM/12TM fusion protein|uniref:TRAP transporter permease n=1 Tax=Colwellia polaris TaxID=326537 RepID=UPI000A1711AB|nr:TRAP transporter fused permease subunit [Colwellia polaris]|tara:strand:- start:4390 stop:6423 length:2034 start_codon:yes stop_codon:yes gene_type:complete
MNIKNIKIPMIYWLAVLSSLIHVGLNYFAIIPENWAAATHFALFGCLGSLIHFKKLWQQIAVSVGIIASSTYLIFAEDSLYERGQTFIGTDFFFSALAIILALVLMFKAIGWFIPTLIVVFLTYITVWGQYVTGVFNFPGLSWETMLFRSYFSTDGMFGTIAQLSWTFVFMFVLFGAFLQVSGAGDYLLKVAGKLASRFRGGSGLVSVLASGLMGSVSGSAIANTAATGVITIPSMKKAGYSAEFAGGVEAAASTGGQLMPPVMGAGAFIMASYTQLPYLTIVTAALLPALLYYITVGFFVRAYAIKRGIDIPNKLATDSSECDDNVKNGWRHLVSIGILVTCLIIGFTPLYAVGMAIVSIILLSWISEKPMKLKEISDALAEGSKGMVVTAILLITIGLMVNAITTTGLGSTFSLMAIEWADGSLLILIVLIAVASLILGAGLPVTASYIIVATLLAPVLSDLISLQVTTEVINNGSLSVSKDMIATLLPAFADGSMPLSDALLAAPSEIRTMLYDMVLSPEILASSLLAAHLVIFWLSQDSNVTPPVCLVAYTAAGIAKGDHTKTAFCAWKLAKGLYIVPILMAYTGLVMGDAEERILIFVFSAIGLFCIIAAWEGVVMDVINRANRLVLGVVGTLLLWPFDGVLLKIVLSVIFLAYLLFSFIQFNKKPTCAQLV